VLERLNLIEAREDLARRLEDEFDQELLEIAMSQVQGRVAAHTWEAFRLTALEGLPGVEAAKRVGMQVAAVFVARSKVQRLLQEAVRQLEAADLQAREAER